MLGASVSGRPVRVRASPASGPQSSPQRRVLRWCHGFDGRLKQPPRGRSVDGRDGPWDLHGRLPGPGNGPAQLYLGS